MSQFLTAWGRREVCEEARDTREVESRMDFCETEPAGARLECDSVSSLPRLRRLVFHRDFDFLDGDFLSLRDRFSTIHSDQIATHG